VSKWLGHSITASGRHYANAVPDELFAKAAQYEPKPDEAQRQAQQKVRETPGSRRNNNPRHSDDWTVRSRHFKGFTRTVKNIR